MTIAVWCGNGKPIDCNVFLSEFVEELKHLLDDGLCVNNHKITIHISCFICDTPARSFLKGDFESVFHNIYIELELHSNWKSLFLERI